MFQSFDMNLNLGKPTPSKTDDFSEKFQKFMLQIFTIIDDTSVMNFGKNLQHNFPKMRGGIKDRLELFRKFIRFGRGRLPLYLCKLNKTLQEERNYWIASMRDLSKLGEMKFRISQLKISNQPIHGWKGFWSSSYRYWLNATCFHPAIQIYIKRLNKDITRWKNAVKNMPGPTVN